MMEMKTYLSWAPIALAALFLPVLAPAAEPNTAPCAAASPAPSYSSIDINEIIVKVAKRTGKQFIVDPRVRAEIPLVGLDVNAIDYAKLLAILNVHMFGTYESNGVVRVVPDANARQLPIPVTTEIPASALDDEYVTVLITAKNMCVNLAVPVLRPLMPQSAHMAAFAQSNSLIISDHVANARRIVDMVERLDKAAPAGQKCPEEFSSPAKGDKSDKK
jgi:general secretion pathway protein D